MCRRSRGGGAKNERFQLGLKCNEPFRNGIFGAPNAGPCEQQPTRGAATEEGEGNNGGGNDEGREWRDGEAESNQRDALRETKGTRRGWNPQPRMPCPHPAARSLGGSAPPAEKKGDKRGRAHRQEPSEEGRHTEEERKGNTRNHEERIPNLTTRTPAVYMLEMIGGSM